MSVWSPAPASELSPNTSPASTKGGSLGGDEPQDGGERITKATSSLQPMLPPLRIASGASELGSNAISTIENPAPTTTTLPTVFTTPSLPGAGGGLISQLLGLGSQVDAYHSSASSAATTAATAGRETTKVDIVSGKTGGVESGSGLGEVVKKGMATFSVQEGGTRERGRMRWSSWVEVVVVWGVWSLMCW